MLHAVDPPSPAAVSLIHTTASHPCRKLSRMRQQQKAETVVAALIFHMNFVVYESPASKDEVMGRFFFSLFS